MAEKRGKWADRAGEAYNTLSIYIKQWLGGIRNLRRILDQSEHSTIKWDKNSAIAAYKAFYSEQQRTPDQIRHMYRRGAKDISDDVYKMAARICNAVTKYAGGTRSVNKLLGIEMDRPRRWSREAILSGFKQVIEKWGVSPRQLIADIKMGRVQVSDNEYKELCRMVDAVSRQFSSIKEVYLELGFTPPSRPRKRRKLKQTWHT